MPRVINPLPRALFSAALKRAAKGALGLPTAARGTRAPAAAPLGVARLHTGSGSRVARACRTSSQGLQLAPSIPFRRAPHGPQLSLAQPRGRTPAVKTKERPYARRASRQAKGGTLARDAPAASGAPSSRRRPSRAANDTPRHDSLAETMTHRRLRFRVKFARTAMYNLVRGLIAALGRGWGK